MNKLISINIINNLPVLKRFVLLMFGLFTCVGLQFIFPKSRRHITMLVTVIVFLIVVYSHFHKNMKKMYQYNIQTNEFYFLHPILIFFDLEFLFEFFTLVSS